MIRLLVLLVLVVPFACGQVRSSLPDASAAVPSALVGEWSGTWTSAAGDSGGDLALRV